MKKRHRTNYEKQIDNALEAFVFLDHDKIISKFSLKSDDDYIYINQLGVTYRFHKTEGTVERSYDMLAYTDDVNFNEAASIFDLFTYSKDNLYLTGEWANIWNIEKNIHVGHSSNSSFLKSHEEQFTGKIPLIEQACIKLGGEKAEFADISYIIYAFDFLPMMFQFWDADEEFPARIRILWDKTILNYIRFETTFSLQFQLLDRIYETMKQLSTGETDCPI